MAEQKSSVQIITSFHSRRESFVNFQPFCETPKCVNVHNGQLNHDSEEVATVSNYDLCSFGDYSAAFETVRDLSGPWQSHRFEKEPWLDSSKLLSKLEKAVYVVPEKRDSLEEENEEEQEVNETEAKELESEVLTDDVIKSSLSYLERSPVDLKHVLCRGVLSNKGLRDITVLKYYHYIQYLDISKNEITTLAALEQVPFLQYLDASNNMLENVLDFKAPLFLSYVNLSNNFISVIPDLTQFWSLTDLDFSNNRIEKISGLENLRYLTCLNLSHNKIQALENLNNLPIQLLNLNHNLIESNVVEDDPVYFSTLDCIRLVDLSHNSISSLEMFRDAENIEGIDLSSNNISSLLELYNLSNLRYLSRVNFKLNPVTSSRYYFNVCVQNIKNLIILDGKKIPAEKRISAHINTSPLYPGNVPHIELMLLQQINYPKIGPYIVPVNHPSPLIVFLVGPAGSKRRNIVQKFCKLNKWLVPGVVHTTRPKKLTEVDGEYYYFVSNEEFKKLLRNGKFMSFSEFRGYSYGIIDEEMAKADQKIMIFHSNLKTALSMKMKGARTVFILAMPRSEVTHLNWLQEKYFTIEINHYVMQSMNKSNARTDGSSSSQEMKSYMEKMALVKDLVNRSFDVTFKEDSNTGTGNTASLDPSNDSMNCSLDDSEPSNFSGVYKWEAVFDRDTKSQTHSPGSKKVSFSDGRNSGAASNKKGTGYVKDKKSKCDRKIQQLNEFFASVIKSRQELLELHWSEPGLFNTIIFTDEVRQCLKKLKAAMESVLQGDNLIHPILPSDDDDTNDRIRKIRLANLDLQGFKLYKGVIPPHCDCDSIYVEKYL